MTCPCGYYSTCWNFCTPSRIKDVKATTPEEHRKLQREHQADYDNAKIEQDWFT